MQGENLEKVERRGRKANRMEGWKKKRKKREGAPGFEPGTSRSAVECSATELYPHNC